ncbi:MFS transporter [Streptococcus ruminantium]|uniref:MFS transporter n=1 Tax=Streptococcus ruminantium TaxID=1917441 RepID=UPI001F2EF139|nr:MFS transporter [Streptococcus ruminantium]
MKLLLKNIVYRVITFSRMLNSLGSYIYNLVFIIYASSLPQATFAVFIANMVTVIPTVFTFWVGIKADRTRNKVRLMIAVGFIQAILFTLVAVMIENKTFFVFSFVCLLNVVSDVLSDYASGLRLPILQKNIQKEDLFEAYSFSQFSSYLCNIVGQTFGVWLLSVSNNNFSFVAIINALSFVLSAVVLLMNKKKLSHEPVIASDQQDSLLKQFKEMYSNMNDIFKKSNNTSFIKILLSVLVINALGGAVSSIYNFYFMQHGLFSLSYGQSLLVVQIVLLVGAIWGSLTPHDYFAKKSFSTLLVINSSLFGILGFVNFTLSSPLFGIATLFFAAYIMGKSVPKLDALLMESLPSNILAQSNNFLGMLFTLSLPVGTFIFSSLATYNINITWFVFTIVSMVALFFSTVKDLQSNEK